MPLPGGLWWLLCCRRGFTLLHRDYGDGELSGDGDEDEDEETFELRTPSPAGGGRGPLDVTLTQPVRSGPVSDRLQSWEETRSLIPEKGPPEEDPDVVVKGWLYREPRGGGARPWLPPRRAWFVLTRDSLDQFSSGGKGARRLGSLVLTSLCSVTGPERRPKETGLWSVTVSGRKHSVRLCSPRQAEAERWGVALREVIASKAPLETPTQLLLRDIQESCGDPEAVALIYRRNPILRHTSGALYAPLLPLPYGVSAPGPGYAPLREEAVRLFLALQALEGARRPGPLMQGVLQTCRDLPALRDELFLQLAKQTSGPAGPPGPPATQDPAALRYWQLLTCMSCTFRPGGAVRGHLLGHLERTEQALPDTELAEYARFIRKALGRTRGRELVPSLAEISALSQRQELLCTVHCPGAGACPVAIDSHTTAGEVARELVGRLGLARSRNAFALYEQRGAQERVLAGGTLMADVLTSGGQRLGGGPASAWHPVLISSAVWRRRKPRWMTRRTLVGDYVCVFTGPCTLRGCLQTVTNYLSSLSRLTLCCCAAGRPRPTTRCAPWRRCVCRACTETSPRGRPCRAWTACCRPPPRRGRTLPAPSPGLRPPPPCWPGRSGARAWPRGARSGPGAAAAGPAARREARPAREEVAPAGRLLCWAAGSGYGAWAELRPWLPTWLWRRSVQGSALLGMTFWS
ncbi:pleckstrin homology domain-containing family H member 3 isoform X4 [Callorhinus ursinus]|uniref:pleckstrin homology domain-containing family H member 3 isoform X4 n=1 Tax=Callorhinus ursinus TaxID=34884 RepID=UPI003CD016D7